MNRNLVQLTESTFLTREIPAMVWTILPRKIEEVPMKVPGLDLENSYSCLGSGESTAALVSLY